MAPSDRILLPKLAAKGQGENDQVAAATQRRTLPPRRRNAPVACQTCRRRKVKCGGGRPKCHQCEKASIDCVYDAPAGLSHRQADKEQITRLQATVEHLRQRVSAQSTPISDQLATSLSPRSVGASPAGSIHPDVQSSVDLVDLLRDQPEGFALQALEFLRQGRSPKAIMESIGGNLSTNVNPSMHAAARGTMIPTQTPLEFQLVVQHPKVYSPLAPLTTASLDLGLLGIQPLDTGMTPDTQLSTLFYRDAPSTVVDRTVQPQDMIGKTAFSVESGIPIDPRLHHVEISRYTNVTISNEFAVEAISLYLNMNQPWWAFFDTDMFLDDLVSMQNRFCSRMLVNALLAWATQSYAHYEPMAATLPTKLLDEALQIYDSEKNIDRLTTVAATSLMSMTWTTLGKDKAGRRLQEHSARMAQRMGLYGESDSVSYHQLDLSDERVEAAVCATAWGSFNFQIIWFHTAIIDLFRPFEHEFPQPKLPAFAGVNATPKAVISASIEQLKRLIYQYRANCESSKYSIIWQSGMLYLVNHILRDLSSNESQFYFLLCMRGYQYLARYMPFVSGIVQSLIVMTNRQGVSLTANTQRLLEEVRDESRRSREFFSAYPVDLEMVAKDPSSASLEKLTSRFQEEPLGASQCEAADSGSLPDGWKGSVQDLTTTLSILKDD
ncbi:Uncharacterized protein LW93_7132 [Fusarium fujikuroi]|nr:Uncharacterized protein LW93_7132 [Fusarium fujikuroi]